jgi:hypothetical protein
MRIFAYLPLVFLLFACQPEQKFSQLEDYTSPGGLARIKDGKMVQVSSYDTTGGNNDRINIHEGMTATIFDVDGPGLITRIWVTIDSRDPHFLRRILLRMYWDDEKNPSVEVPVGDFFGCGYAYQHYTAQYLGMSSGGYYCYFPMPFNEGARIEVVNETGQEIYAFYYHIDYFQLDHPFEENVAYFHSAWNREVRTDTKMNYTVLHAEGTGHFVGCNIHAQPYNRSFWYLEGDEMVYVDGEVHPSIYGTGTEDYFTSGWYYKNGEYAAPYHGLLMKDESTMRTVAYRHHIPDPIPFREKLHFTIEHGHGNEEVIDMSSTAYWYQVEPHKPQAILKSGQRIPLRVTIPNGCLEAGDLEFESATLEALTLDMSDYGAEWSNLDHLFIDGDENSSFTLTASGLYETAYDATLYYTRGPDYGMVEVAAEGVNKGRFDGYHTELFPDGQILLEGLRALDGKLTLDFLITDKDQDSKGYSVGLDGIKLHPKRQFIPEWHLIGPFPNERESDLLRYGLDEPYPPESGISLDKEYTGAQGQPVSWKKITTPENGYISLWDKFTPYEFVVCYAVSYIHAEQAMTVPLLTGSDDGSKVFLNQSEIHRFLDVRIAAPDQDTIPLHLNKGWNELLMKVENNFGGYAFYARVIDRNGKLRYSAVPPKP